VADAAVGRLKRTGGRRKKIEKRPKDVSAGRTSAQHGSSKGTRKMLSLRKTLKKIRALSTEETAPGHREAELTANQVAGMSSEWGLDLARQPQLIGAGFQGQVWKLVDRSDQIVVVKTGGQGVLRECTVANDLQAWAALWEDAAPERLLRCLWSHPRSASSLPAAAFEFFDGQPLFMWANQKRQGNALSVGLVQSVWDQLQ